VRELNVSDCGSLVEVFGSVEEVTKKSNVTTHYQLQNMTLDHLPKLSHIWKHDIVEVISSRSLQKLMFHIVII